MSTGIAAKAFANMLRDQPVTDMHREDCRGCGEGGFGSTGKWGELYDEMEAEE